MRKLIKTFMLMLLWAASQSILATTVIATYNSTTGRYEATLDDGTVMGFGNFSLPSPYAYPNFVQTTSKTVTLPDSVVFMNGTSNKGPYPLEYIAYVQNTWKEAESVTSIVLPATLKHLISFTNTSSPNRFEIPKNLKELHFKNNVSEFNVTNLSSLTLYVPEDLLDSFLESDLRKYALILAEGAEPLKITINMTKAGEFAQKLLEKTDNWNKVNELTVTGPLDEDDLNVFKHMKQLTKLDLSKAIIDYIPHQFGGVTYESNGRDGFCCLEEVSLPAIQWIGNWAFAQTYKLKKVTIPSVEQITWGAFSYSGISEITLPDNIYSIGGYAFSHSSISQINLPESLTSIAEYAFQYCPVKHFDIPSKIQTICDCCFYYSTLESITLPNSVSIIGQFAFSGTKLQTINLPGVAEIKRDAFSDCRELASVTFSNKLKILRQSPFYLCTALTEIDLPSTLLSMDSYAFHGCTNIKKVISRATTPPTHNNNYTILYGCDLTDVTLYVPAMSIDKYRKEGGWKEFYTIKPIEDKTTYAYIYDDAIIDDGSEFTKDCEVILDWQNQNRNGDTRYYCGALNYNGNSTLSMKLYRQYHYLGYGTSGNNWDGAHFTSLIPTGTMRSDSVRSCLKIYSTSQWYFITLPYDVKVSEIEYTEEAQFAIRKYSGKNRANQTGNTWIDLTEDSVMHAYEGYILRSNKQSAEFFFPAINNTNKNKVFEKQSVVMPLAEYLTEFDHNRSWNLIGNPYPCYYDTRLMDFTAPITVWNSYNSRYDAYSPIDDAYILRPAQAFFVQCPVDKNAITFAKEGRQKDVTVRNIKTDANSRKMMASNRKVFNVYLSNSEVTDRTRFVINESATLAYELDKDASKFTDGDNTSMLVYTIEEGVRYAINERPMAEGSVSLGFFAPMEGEYSLSLNTTAHDDITLIDHETGIRTALNDRYWFSATGGYNDTRFTLVFGEVSAIYEAKVNDVDIKLADNTLTCNAPYSVLTIDGRLLDKCRSGESMSLPKGIYIVCSRDVKRKITVK